MNDSLISSLPSLDAMPDELEVVVVLNVGDDISTDEIIPAGPDVLAAPSDIASIAEYCFRNIDAGYVRRAREVGAAHAIIAGDNYGKGDGNDYAVLAPRSLGLRLVVADSFAKAHHDRLVELGVLPLTFVDFDDDAALVGERLVLEDARRRLGTEEKLILRRPDGYPIRMRHALSKEQIHWVLAGGRSAWESQRRD